VKIWSCRFSKPPRPHSGQAFRLRLKKQRREDEIVALAEKSESPDVPKAARANRRRRSWKEGDEVQQSARRPSAGRRVKRAATVTGGDAAPIAGGLAAPFATPEEPGGEPERLPEQAASRPPQSRPPRLREQTRPYLEESRVKGLAEEESEDSDADPRAEHSPRTGGEPGSRTTRG
jgi:hypothetical protein